MALLFVTELNGRAWIRITVPRVVSKLKFPIEESVETL